MSGLTRQIRNTMALVALAGFVGAALLTLGRARRTLRGEAGRP